MQIFRRPAEGPLRCDERHGSPLKIIVPPHLRAVPPGEVLHSHPYHEYYIVLEGRGMLEVEGRTVPLEADTVVMVQPGERHRVVAVDAEQGIRWVVVGERLGAKVVVPDLNGGNRDGAVTIRAFQPQDQAAARALILAGLGEHFGIVDETRNPDLDDIAATYPWPTALFLVAEAGGALIGTGALITHDTPPGEGWIVRVSVAPEWRRHGLGRAMVRELVSAAPAHGLTRLRVETNWDWDAAIRLYTHCGFSEYARDAENVYFERDLREGERP